MDQEESQEAEIAEMVLDGPENGGITRAEGRRRLAELSNPLADFSAGGAQAEETGATAPKYSPEVQAILDKQK